jgi:Protein of unknown function (DUF3987)
MADLTPEGLADFAQNRIKWNPVPLRKDLRPEEYPVADLPPLIRDAVMEVQAYVQAPLALVAACALSVVSAAVQARFDVQRDPMLTGPSSLYFLTVAESGERKSQIDRLFMAPLNEWQARQMRAYKEKRALYEKANEAWVEEGETLEHNIKIGLFQERLGTALCPRMQHEARKPKEPRKAEVLRGDDTTEALLIAMQDYPVAAVMSAEAGLIFGSHSMNAERAMGNLSVFNVLWDGGTVRQKRVSREPIYVERPRATLGLMVQSAVLQNFTARSGDLAKGIGYFARFLFSRPESTMGSRYYAEPPENMPALRLFQARVAALLDVEAEFDELDRLAPKLVLLDDQARRTWIAFHDEVEEQLGGDDVYSGIREVASKAAENAARLACCFHVFSTDTPSPVARATMHDACAVMRWYLDEAVRFGQVSGLTKEVQDAELVEQFLVAQMKLVLRGKLDANKLTVNRIRQHGPGALRGKAKDIDAAVETLCDHGRIRVFSEPGSKSRRIAVAPEVMLEYA